MSHKNKISLPQQVYDKLQTLEGFGRSKHEDKRSGVTDQYIYSFSTMRAYLQQGKQFAKWAHDDPQLRSDLGRKPRTLEECIPAVERYIRHNEQRGLSPYTIKLQISALAKLYQKTFDFDTIRTARSKITRSRDEAVRDKHFSEKKNADLVNFCRCVGPRRFEMAKMQPFDLRYINGQPHIQIKGKGGRIRYAPVIGSPDEIQKALVYLSTLTGHNRVHSCADIHGYRADYATRIYKSHARPIEELRGKKINYTALTGKTGKGGQTIYKSALYVCRGDQAGRSYDRAAMLIASASLGHNRESVVGEHYLRV